LFIWTKSPTSSVPRLPWTPSCHFSPNLCYWNMFTTAVPPFPHL
jgi:hypothetical protein